MRGGRRRRPRVRSRVPAARAVDARAYPGGGADSRCAAIRHARGGRRRRRRDRARDRGSDGARRGTAPPRRGRGDRDGGQGGLSGPTPSREGDPYPCRRAPAAGRCSSPRAGSSTPVPMRSSWTPRRAAALLGQASPSTGPWRGEVAAALGAPLILAGGLTPGNVAGAIQYPPARGRRDLEDQSTGRFPTGCGPSWRRPARRRSD